MATAQAYLAIIAPKRQVEVSLRARETSLAHLDYARRRLEAGAGTRRQRAARRTGGRRATRRGSKTTHLGVRIAQEALGVLMAANGPVDAAAEPVFDVPPTIDAEAGWMALRPDIRLFAATERAADRVWRDSSKDWFPDRHRDVRSAGARPREHLQFSARSWRFVVNFSQPVFDGGVRRGTEAVSRSPSSTCRGWR